MSTRIPDSEAAMRKTPRQARSRATVDAIVTAGARVLDTRGWSGFTTNEVANVAGVSIGSLYQYFPNKMALVDAIRRRHFDDVLTVLRRAHGSQRPPSRRLIEGLVNDMISIHQDYPALHRTLLDLPNHDETKPEFELFQKAYLREYEAVIVAWRGSGHGKADKLTAQVLSSAIEGAIHNAARRDVLADPKFKRELVSLACRYLGDAPPGDSEPASRRH
jgi:AcrR family transcriptional regulator